MHTIICWTLLAMVLTSRSSVAALRAPPAKRANLAERATAVPVFESMLALRPAITPMVPISTPVTTTADSAATAAVAPTAAPPRAAPLAMEVLALTAFSRFLYRILSMLCFKAPKSWLSSSCINCAVKASRKVSVSRKRDCAIPDSAMTRSANLLGSL